MRQPQASSISNADQEGRDRHGADRKDQRRPPAEPVTDVADHHAAERPHQIAESEHPKRSQKLRDRVLVREEMPADRHREVAVDGEVVPLQGVADHAGGDDLAGLRGIHRLGAASVCGSDPG
jgi:hypothetical protein